MEQTKSYAFDVKDIEETGRFEGYASVFGGPPDLQGDRIKRGAFTRTLAETGGKWPILMGHLMARPVGFCIGAEEDAKGLKVLGEFTLGSTEGQNAYETVKHAARVKQPFGLSIGYGIPEGGAKFSDAGRELTDIDVYEFSLASVPACPRARIARVKGAGERFSVRECEEILRDAGFSAGDAKCIIHSLSGQRDVEPAPAPGAPDGRAAALLGEARAVHFLTQVKGIILNV